MTRTKRLRGSDSSVWEVSGPHAQGGRIDGIPLLPVTFCEFRVPGLPNTGWLEKLNSEGGTEGGSA